MWLEKKTRFLPQDFNFMVTIGYAIRSLRGSERVSKGVNKSLILPYLTDISPKFLINNGLVCFPYPIRFHEIGISIYKFTKKKLTIFISYWSFQGYVDLKNEHVKTLVVAAEMPRPNATLHREQF